MAEVKAARSLEERPFTRADLHAAIMLGAMKRGRPKMMTVVAIMAGLVPILWSIGTGSEVMQRIAVPMIGGIVSFAVLTLMVISSRPCARKGLAAIAMGGSRRAGARSLARRVGRRTNMMHDMMGGMGWPMGLFGLIGAAVLLLVVAALVKYVFFR